MLVIIKYFILHLILTSISFSHLFIIIFFIKLTNRAFMRFRKKNKLS